MNKTKIEWTDYTWNPIKGVCPVGCWYCYARAMYKRLKWNPKIRVDPDEYPGMVFMPFYDYPKRIFVGSTFELFHPSVKKEWRDWIFDAIEYNDRHTFQILTKLPQNIDRPMPDNVWLGVTATGEDYDLDFERFEFLNKAKAKIKFVSYEPILGNMSFYPAIQFNWIILGRLTGYGNKHDPKREDIKWLVDHARIAKTPVFIKDNLKEIWHTPLIQEFPE